MCKLAGLIISLAAVLGICTNLRQAVANSSDFNLDGRVDAADLARWESAFGLDSDIVPQADADLDGDTDGRDFLAWQTEASDSLLLAPEPTTIALALPFLLFMIARRSRPTNIYRFESAHTTLKPSGRLLNQIAGSCSPAVSQTNEIFNDMVSAT